MSTEQIEELERLDAEDTEAPVFALPRPVFRRLLEERKRLLEALAHAVETLDDGPDKWPYTKAPDLWREVIAFAEAPAE